MTILYILLGSLVLPMFIALFMKKQYYVKRDIVVNAPLEKIFGFLRLLENQEKFNKWAKGDPDRKKEFKGTDGTEGFIYSWSGNKKAGVGEKEITGIVEGKRIETEIRFVKPMEATASGIFETEAISENRTKVSFSNSGKMKYPLNIMIPMFEKNFAKDMDESLLMLKGIFEK